MSIYQRNLDFFRNNEMLDLCEALQAETPLNEVLLEKVDGQLNYIMQTEHARCFVHSIYDIENELNAMFRDVDKNASEIVLFGLGCGYAIDYIFKTFKKVNHLIIIEPSLQMFRQYAEVSDISIVVRKFRRVTFIVNKSAETTSEMLSFKALYSRKMFFAFCVSYCTIFHNYYETMANMVIERLKQSRTHINTAVESRYPWLINSLKNMHKKSIRVEDIFEILSGRPVVMVSAGPSLNKNMHLLNEVKKKAIIIAVGMAVKILDSNGIIPHFRVAIDGFPREMHIMEGIDTTQAPLIFANQLYYEFLLEYKGPTIRMILNTDHIGNYLYKKAGIDFVRIGTGASVANCILSLLCQAGCKDVIFVGQDLCYVETAMYAKGASLDLRQKGFDKKKYVKIKDACGNDVYTTNVFLTMKYGLEDIIKKYPKIRFINATEGGLRIEGTKPISLSDVTEHILSEDLHLDIMKEINKLEKHPSGDAEYSSKLKDSIDILHKEIIDVMQINDEIYRILKKVDADRRNGINADLLLTDLRSLETFNERLMNNTFYDGVLVNALNDVLKSLMVSMEYGGSDLDKKVASVYDISMNRVVEAQKYAALANQLVNELVG